MNTNLYFKELKRNRKNLFIWSGIVVGLTLMVLAIFPFMAEMGDSMGALMESIPPELSKALGMNADSWSSILGFYSTYYGVYIVVLISIFTTSVGATIISKEEKDQTSEFLLTRPISRKEIVWTKLMTLFTLCLIIYFLQTFTALIGIYSFTTTEVDWSTFTNMHGSGLVLILFFTTLGIIISMLVKPKKNFMGIVVGLTFGSYFLNAIGKSADAVSWIAYGSPFNYLEITSDSATTFAFLPACVLLVMGCILLVVSNFLYAKKDIVG